jgi:hypothetical protein
VTGWWFSSGTPSLVNDAAIFKDKYLSWKSWKQWCSDIFGSMSSFSDDPNVDDLQGESPALERKSVSDL